MLERTAAGRLAPEVASNQPQGPFRSLSTRFFAATMRWIFPDLGATWRTRDARRTLGARPTERPAPAPCFQGAPGGPAQAAATQVRWGRGGPGPGRRQRPEEVVPWGLVNMVLLALCILVAPPCATTGPQGTNCQPTTLTHVFEHASSRNGAAKGQAAGTYGKDLSCDFTGQTCGPIPLARDRPESWPPQSREQGWGPLQHATPAGLTQPGGGHRLHLVMVDLPVSQDLTTPRGRELVKSAPFGNASSLETACAGQQPSPWARGYYGGSWAGAAGEMVVSILLEKQFQASFSRLVWRGWAVELDARGSEPGVSGRELNVELGSTGTGIMVKVVIRSHLGNLLRSWGYLVAFTLCPPRRTWPRPVRWKPGFLTTRTLETERRVTHLCAHPPSGTLHLPYLVCVIPPEPRRWVPSVGHR